jgi:hypothetical protein
MDAAEHRRLVAARRRVAVADWKRDVAREYHETRVGAHVRELEARVNAKFARMDARRPLLAR